VCLDKNPDIIASAVAIETKRDNKGWTIKELVPTLSRQLVAQYLGPANCRYGVLVVSLDKPRNWLDQKPRRRITFDQMVGHLAAPASTFTRNATAAITVRVVGLTALQPISPIYGVATA
jgi:hypothetical protein